MLQFRANIKLGILASLIFGLTLYFAIKAYMIIHTWGIMTIRNIFFYVHPFFGTRHGLIVGYIISIFLLITALGMLGFIVNKFEIKIAWLIKKIPLIGRIWNFFESIFQTFRNHLWVVQIKDYPTQGAHPLAIITGKVCSEEQGIRSYYPAVNLSSSPNPFTGQLTLLVERNKLRVLNVKFEDYAQIIITGGISMPKDLIFTTHPDQDAILDTYYNA